MHASHERTSVVTVRLEADVIAGLDRLAAADERSRAWIMAKAPARDVGEQTELMAFIQVGIDSAERGELIGQDEMEGWLEARYAPGRAAAG